MVPIAKKTQTIDKPIVNKTKIQTSNKPSLTSRRTSALSLKSLTVKREETTVKKVAVNLDELPKNPFTKQELLNLWASFSKQLNKKGEQLLASMMRSNVPEVSLNTLTFTLPNSRMESSLLKSKPRILKHLRDQLQNYQIDFKIIVNEKIEKKFAYTPKEKFDVLREKNELISKLKSTFDLDV